MHVGRPWSPWPGVMYLVGKYWIKFHLSLSPSLFSGALSGDKLKGGYFGSRRFVELRGFYWIKAVRLISLGKSWSELLLMV